MKKRKKWTLWRIICFSGLPWFFIFIMVGIYIKKWDFEGYLLGKTIVIHNMKELRVIIRFSALGWMIVFFKNWLLLDAGRTIGLFTWLEHYRYEPPPESLRKRQAQHPPVEEEYLSERPDGLVLGRQGKYYVRFPIKKGHALSTIILGTPGSGKSTLLLTTLIYQLNKKPKQGRKKAEQAEVEQEEERQVFFILDVKPELLRKSSHPGDKHIRELSILDRSKWGWDPYYGLRPDATDDEILSELDVIVRAFIESPKDGKNEFFYESARAIFKFMALAQYKKGRSFMQTVDRLMDANLTEMIKKTLENADGKPELMKVRKGLNAYTGKDSSEAFQGIEMAFRQSMEIFQKDATKFFLDGNPRKLSPLTLEEKISVAFTIKTTQIKEYKTILRLVVMQLLHHCEERDEETSHLITLVIDEAYRLGIINWIDFLSVCRSKQVSCVLAFQSLSQMMSVWSKEDADSLLEMVSAIGVLSCRSKTTAEMICSWAGEYYEEKISSNVGGKNDGSYSRTFELRKVLQPTDLMKLKRTNEIILFLDGEYYRVNVERAKYYMIPELNNISKKCVEAHKRIDTTKEV